MFKRSPARTLVADTQARLQQSLPMRWLRRLLERTGTDLAFRFASQAFVSLVPILIVAAALQPIGSGRSFRDTLLAVLGLRGAPQEVLRSLFTNGGQVHNEITWLSFLFVVISGLSFTRTLQRIFEQGWELPRAGMRGTGRGLLWLLSLVLYLAILALCKGLLPGSPAGTLLDVMLSLAASGAFWLWTADLALGGRIAWQRLVPGAVVTAVALVVLGAASSLYMPDYIASKAAKFGDIGVVFAIFLWFLVIGYIVLAGATVGPVLAEGDSLVARFMAGKVPVRPQPSPPPEAGPSE